MMHKTVLFIALLSVVHGALSFSTGFLSDDDFDTSSSVVNYALERRRGRSDHDAIILAKMLVPAAVHDDFISAWKKLEKSTHDERGLINYDMKKTKNDNSLFLIYGHWKSWDDYLDHLGSKHFEQFQDIVEREEINVRVVPLKRVSDAEIHRKKEASKSKDMMHAVFGFWVDPKHHEDFIKRWEQLADETSEEKAVHVYTLRKSELDNMLFIAYGVWDSRQDFRKHHFSKHAHNFREFKEKHNIVWKMWPLQKIGSQPE